MKKICFNKWVFFLFLIIFLGFLLRVYRVADIPSGFFADEAANGFNAYKILTTGRDEHGIPFPFYFRSFGDYRNPVVIYSMIPLVAIFGLNEFAVRLTMVIYGTGTILLLFFLTREIFFKSSPFTKTVLPLTSALFLSISPWHIQFSRTGFEFISMPFFLVLSLFLFFRFIHRGPLYLLLLSAFSFVITFYTYYPIQLVLIPFIIGIIFMHKKILFFKTKAFRISSILFFLIFLLGMLAFVKGVFNGQALTRFHSVSPLSQSNIKEIAPKLIDTYLKHFSLDFLFTKGDIDMPGHFITRHSVHHLGELYLFQLPLLIVGLIFLSLRFPKILGLFLLWFSLYPIGSAIVGNGPFAHRSIFGLIPFQILSAFGLTVIFEFFNKIEIEGRLLQSLLKIIIGGFLMTIFFFSLQQYVYKYFIEYRLYSSDFWGWQYGPREIIRYFVSEEKNYDELIMSGQFNSPEIFLKFYAPNNCQKCKIGNVKLYNPDKRQLFALSPEEVKEMEYVTKKIIYYPNQQIAFKVVEFKHGQ